MKELENSTAHKDYMSRISSFAISRAYCRDQVSLKSNGPKQEKSIYL
jgi:hypothetical protein